MSIARVTFLVGGMPFHGVTVETEVRPGQTADDVAWVLVTEGCARAIEVGAATLGDVLASQVLLHVVAARPRGRA